MKNFWCQNTDSSLIQTLKRCTNCMTTYAYLQKLHAICYIVFICMLKILLKYIDLQKSCLLLANVLVLFTVIFDDFSEADLDSMSFSVIIEIYNIDK